MRKSNAVSKPGRHGGIALIEVLISSFIMATGMLAVLSMQTMALSRVQANTQLLQAEWLLNDMLERMKGNPLGFASVLPARPGGQQMAHCQTRTGCSPAELAAHDLVRWHERIETLLPGGRGEVLPVSLTVYPEGKPIYQVRVVWQLGQGDLQMPVSSGLVALR